MPSKVQDAITTRQCSGGKVVRCTGLSAEHSPVSWGSWGNAIPRAALFSCTVNGTFSFRRDEKRMWGWNCGFWKLSRSGWQKPIQSLRRGTFHRRKVPKGRWGTFDVPQTPDDHLLRGTAVPLAGEGIPPGDGGRVVVAPLHPSSAKTATTAPHPKKHPFGCFFCAIFTFSRFPVPLPPCGTA